ncbi:MAG: metal-dependent transcriptional regulator [Ignisphaera sp.]|uniref:Metal-dependent transcriptional regulator n=1 Tax=Ignisphaera aggregans TaxID=334771 RepID=A0A832FVV5_9CREN
MQKEPANGLGISRVHDYLTTIYRLEEALGIAKTTEISKELGVSPATVSKIIKKLEERNLVKRVKYKYIKLTEEGRKIAEQIIRKHRISEVFLVNILGFNEIDAHIYAHYLEHLPDIIIEKMYNITGKPGKCPHGNPIPGIIQLANKLVNLSNTKKDQKCTIHQIAGEFLEILRYLYNLGIKIGDTTRVLEHTNREVILEINETLHVKIPIYIARYIFVKC